MINIKNNSKSLDNTLNLMYNYNCQEVQKGGLLDGRIRKRGKRNDCLGNAKISKSAIC